MNFTDLSVKSNQQSNGWKLDYSTHVISNALLDKNARDFKNRIWIKRPEERAIQLSNLMYEQYTISSISAMEYPRIEGIKAVRVYFGLDLDSNKIRHYFEPVMMLNPVEEERNTFQIPLSTSSQSHSERFVGTLYKIQDANLVRIDSIASEMEEFIKMWNNYKDCIRFESFLLDDWRLRSFNLDDDTESAILPLDIFLKIASDNERESAFIYSTLSVSDRRYKHSFCLSYEPVEARTESYSMLSLIFKGISANYSQLCPTRCGKLKAEKDETDPTLYRLI